MAISSRSLVNLFLLLLLLAVYVIFSTEDEAPPAERLTQLQLDEISLIHIPRNNNNDIVIEKISDDSGQEIWQMQQPYSIKAHDFRVNTLLKLSQLPLEKSWSVDDLDLADYGLEPPRARIQFNQQKIAFGKTSPLNHQRYLLHNNKISLHADETYPLVSAQPASLVDLNLLPQADIISLNSSQLQLHQNDAGRWQSNQQLTADQIQTILQQWKNAQAFAVHAYMPRKQLGKISIQLAQQTIEFEITDDDPWLILARPELGIEYHLDAALKNRLLGDL